MNSNTVNILIVIVFIGLILYIKNKDRITIEAIKRGMSCLQNLPMKETPFTIDFNTPARVTATYTQKIPFIFFQTGRYPLDADRRQCILINRALNPEYEHRFYDEEGRIAYIREHEPDLLPYYNKFLPPAYRADMFRCVVLYYEGGIYLDDKSTSIFPFSHYIKPEKEFAIFEDAIDGYGFNGFIASAPGHPIMRLNIDQMKHHVKTNYYGLTPLDPTGPGLMGKCINKFLGRAEGTSLITISDPRIDIIGKVRLIKKEYSCLCDKQDSPLINRCYRGYYSAKHIFSNYYGVKWVFRDIYKS